MSEQNILGQVEALLFVAGKPLGFKDVAKQLGCRQSEVQTAIGELNKMYFERQSGLKFVVAGDKVQLFTAPQFTELINTYLAAERQAELTRPSLETLSIIAYRGPISKEEAEQIRGVNCSLIIRNLLIRGLIVEIDRNNNKLYEVTHDFLKHLGVSSVCELPNYEELSQHESLEKLLELASERTSGQEV